MEQRVDTNRAGEVVDLFCGVGAISHGFYRAGFDILAGYDTDSQCKYAFERNNKSAFHAQDVAALSGKDVRKHFTGEAPSVLVGCAPCQPFSSYKQRYAEDPQWELVPRFGEIAAECAPDYVSMENVPRLLEHRDGAIFEKFKSLLEAEGYGVWYSIVNSADYGVPQSRRRLVLVAAKNGGLAPPETWTSSAVTVREAIGHLPKIKAGEVCTTDPLHRSSSLSDKNLRRIQASKPGGSWKDWPKELVAECHKRSTGRTYPSVYGRMSWDAPSPTITTQSYGFGNGRFGHPEQDRAISLREAAILQSFPEGYEFLPANRQVSIKELGRWIGNAVPVKLAESIAKGIKSHKEFSNDGRPEPVCDEHRLERDQASRDRAV